MTTSSKATQTVSQRKSTAVRRAFGILALVGLFALPQAASAQARASHGDNDRARQHIVHDRSGTQHAQQRQRVTTDRHIEATPIKATPPQARRNQTVRASRLNDGPRSRRNEPRHDGR